MTTDPLKPVALISMPTLSARFPSFQLALLKPTLERQGIPVQTFSLFMYFGTQVGWRLNETLSDVYPCMLGEWIWTKAAFGDFSFGPDPLAQRSEEHTSELQSRSDLVCRLLLEKKNYPLVAISEGTTISP